MSRVAFFILAIASVLVFVGACSSGATCGASDKCSADPAPTQSASDECNKLSSGACGSQYMDVLACQKSAQKCAADNTTDEAATELAIATNCGTQVSEFGSCCDANPTACQ